MLIPISTPGAESVYQVSPGVEIHFVGLAPERYRKVLRETALSFRPLSTGKGLYSRKAFAGGAGTLGGIPATTYHTHRQRLGPQNYGGGQWIG